MFWVLVLIACLAPCGIWLASSQDWNVARKAFTWLLLGAIVAIPVWQLIGYLFPGHDISTDDAKHEFSREFSCPEARIEADRRSDVNVWETEHGASSAEPPAEIKADPARYQLWKQQQDETHRSHENRGPVFHMSGCGHEVLYECYHPQQTFGGRVATFGSVTCRTFEESKQSKHVETARKRSPADGADGSLPKSTVQALLDANKAKLVECGKAISGIAELTETIDPDGTGSNAYTPNDPNPLPACISKVMSQIHFPTAKAATYFMLSIHSNYGEDFSAVAVYE